jgi:hypothetical protein
MFTLQRLASKATPDCVAPDCLDPVGRHAGSFCVGDRLVARLVRSLPSEMFCVILFDRLLSMKRRVAVQAVGVVARHGCVVYLVGIPTVFSIPYPSPDLGDDF